MNFTRKKFRARIAPIANSLNRGRVCRGTVNESMPRSGTFVRLLDYFVLVISSPLRWGYLIVGSNEIRIRGAKNRQLEHWHFPRGGCCDGHQPSRLWLRVLGASARGSELCPPLLFALSPRLARLRNSCLDSLSKGGKVRMVPLSHCCLCCRGSRHSFLHRWLDHQHLDSQSGN